jgi:type IV pilus assembly protein PilV
MESINNRGFSLLEVLLGVTVFMIGMLGVTALNISSLKSNTFSGNMSEAVFIAADKIEDLMALDFDHDDLSDDDGDGDGGDQDLNFDGIDDDDPDDTDAPQVVDGKLNFGLDDLLGDEDHQEGPLGKNGIYTVWWNVAEDEPINEMTKRINVFVEWDVKGVKRRININTIRVDGS